MKKKIIMVADVETTKLGYVYDLGYLIADKYGNVLAERSFVIEDIFKNEKLMKDAYYYSKHPQYIRDILDGKRALMNWNDVMKTMYQDLKEFDVQVFSAYNANFDYCALKRTNELLRNRPFKMVDNLEIWDIWNYAVQTICSQATFKKVAEREKWVTDSGKFYRTSAEIVYAYISKNYDFEEEHTGLEDCHIEYEILMKAIRQNKKLPNGKGIKHMPFKFLGEFPKLEIA